jgi:hypothetical protein
MREPSPTAIAYARALAVWGQWLQHWRTTRNDRAFRTALACKRIALEKQAAWKAELKSRRSVVAAAREERAVRSELDLHRMLRELKRQERDVVHFAVHLPREEITPTRTPVRPVAAALDPETTYADALERPP